jgi:hypothetical protein
MFHTDWKNKKVVFILTRNRDSRVGTRDRLSAERPRFDFRQMQDIILFFIKPRSVLGLTQPPMQWVPEVKREGNEAATHFHLVRRLRMVELYLHTP